MRRSAAWLAPVVFVLIALSVASPLGAQFVTDPEKSYFSIDQVLESMQKAGTQ